MKILYIVLCKNNFKVILPIIKTFSLKEKSKKQ